MEVNMAKKAYQCKDCGKEEVISADVGVPECDDCGKPMKEIPLDECTHPSNSESARSYEVDEACDDGVH
jgi:ribosomal protein L37AE/L43A